MRHEWDTHLMDQHNTSQRTNWAAHLKAWIFCCIIPLLPFIFLLIKSWFDNISCRYQGFLSINFKHYLKCKEVVSPPKCIKHYLFNEASLPWSVLCLIDILPAGFHFDTEDGDKVLPGFLDPIIGIRQGETKSFPLVFPQSWRQENLRGVLAQFTVSSFWIYFYLLQPGILFCDIMA